MADTEYTSTLEYVANKIESEGFDYAFRFYSDFEDVKDEEFHRLRKAYVEAAEALADYIEMNTDDDEEDDDNDQEED